MFRTKVFGQTWIKTGSPDSSSQVLRVVAHNPGPALARTAAKVPSRALVRGSPRAANRTSRCSPSFDRWPQPQPGSARSEVNHRPRHIRIAQQVRVHRVAMTQPEDPRDLGGVNQVLGVDPRAHDLNCNGTRSPPNPGSIHLDTQQQPRRCANTPGRGRNLRRRSRHGESSGGRCARRPARLSWQCGCGHRSGWGSPPSPSSPRRSPATRACSGPGSFRRSATLPLGDVDGLMVRRWISEMSGAGLSASRIQQAHRLLSQLFRSAIECRLDRPSIRAPASSSPHQGQRDPLPESSRGRAPGGRGALQVPRA